MFKLLWFYDSFSIPSLSIFSNSSIPSKQIR
jgi:hypothetical protein